MIIRLVGCPPPARVTHVYVLVMSVQFIYLADSLTIYAQLQSVCHCQLIKGKMYQNMIGRGGL